VTQFPIHKLLASRVMTCFEPSSVSAMGKRKEGRDMEFNGEKRGMVKGKARARVGKEAAKKGNKREPEPVNDITPIGRRELQKQKKKKDDA